MSYTDHSDVDQAIDVDQGDVARGEVGAGPEPVKTLSADGRGRNGGVRCVALMDAQREAVASVATAPP